MYAARRIKARGPRKVLATMTARPRWRVQQAIASAVRLSGSGPPRTCPIAAAIIIRITSAAIPGPCTSNKRCQFRTSSARLATINTMPARAHNLWAMCSFAAVHRALFEVVAHAGPTPSRSNTTARVERYRWPRRWRAVPLGFGKNTRGSKPLGQLEPRLADAVGATAMRSSAPSNPPRSASSPGASRAGFFMPIYSEYGAISSPPSRHDAFNPRASL